jgi:hypothetical protein
MMNPLDAIRRDPPNVWLTSFYGFDPGSWGYLGFSTPGQRSGFIRRSEPGVLVVVYGTGTAAPDQLGKVIGVLQCSHRVNNAKAFMSPMAWAAKEQSAESAGKWDLGVKATRAWRVAPENRPPIADFANETYSPGRGQTIGSQGMPLTTAEAQRLLDLDLQEVPVFGEIPVLEAAFGKGADVLVPSKPGPVSQSPFAVREAEGPKSLYILALDGDTSAFLGREAGMQKIIKVGVSKTPIGRCDDHNRALPRGAFVWRVFRSNDHVGAMPFPKSRAAIEGETEMKRVLVAQGQSLGGEFFLADDQAIEKAWESGMIKANEWASL